MILVDGYGYLIAVSRLGLNGQVDYGDWNLIKNGFTHSESGFIAFTIRGWQLSDRQI